jgi:hypothetical protein
MLTYQNLKNIVEKKGYEFFDNGAYNLNCVWERTDDIFTNMFSDLLHIAYKDNIGAEQYVCLKATTKASLYGKGSVTQPLPGGTAVICPGQYPSAWMFSEGNGTNVAPWGLPYFAQMRSINYWRDANKDNIIDKTLLEKNEIYDTNWHVMAEPLSYNLPGCLPWSEGCMGISQVDMLTVLAPLCRLAIPIWGKEFTGTIMESNDFNAL